MWWLALSILLLCVIESGNLMNPSKISYFNVFALRTFSLCSRGLAFADRAQVFEVVSAYGTVGLSLGIPGVRSYTILLRHLLIPAGM